MTMIDPGGQRDSAAGRLLHDVVLAFPEYRIWGVPAFDRTQFIAEAVSLESSPYALVTTSLDELADELASARSDSRSRTRCSAARLSGASSGAPPSSRLEIQGDH